MPRPPRLKSELDATSPVTAIPLAEPISTSRPPADVPAPSTPAMQHVERPEPTSDAVVGKRKIHKGRVGPYLTEQQADRLRACYVQGWLQDHRGTFSDMLEQFLFEGAQKIERDKNYGQPWPPITAGAIKSLSQMNIEAGRRANNG